MSTLAEARPPAGGVYLQSYLAPLQRFLAIDGATDLAVQAPGEVWVEAHGRFERIPAPAIDARLVTRLAQQLAGATHQAVSRAHPLLAAALPGGERVQLVLPPATRGFPALSVRRHLVADLTLAELAEGGAFERRRGRRAAAREAALAARLAAGDTAGFLALAVEARKNIIVAGGTGSGKTTVLNALLKAVPAHERLIAIEDTPEVVLAQANSVGLLAARGDQGEARVEVEDLLQAALRMRPDRLIVGELRGREAYSYLRAVNSGHPGSITTVHADSAQGALEQIALMVLQAGTALRRVEIIDYVSALVDVVVQLDRDTRGRFIADIRYAGR